MKKGNRKISIPFWAQISGILLIGVLASAIVFLCAPDKSEEPLNEKQSEHIATFAFQDGTVIERKTVKNGKCVFPPSLESEGVFRGWSGDFNGANGDIEVHPVFYNIVEENLFYFDSVYVKEGEEFTLDLYIGGTVNASSGTIVLNYDPDVLKYKESDGMESVKVKKQKTGELRISFDCDTPLKEETLLTQLTFYAKEKDAYSTQVNLTASDVQCFIVDEAQDATYATINNKIYFLQEVEE